MRPDRCSQRPRAADKAVRSSPRRAVPRLPTVEAFPTVRQELSLRALRHLFQDQPLDPTLTKGSVCLEPAATGWRRCAF